MRAATLCPKTIMSVFRYCLFYICSIGCALAASWYEDSFNWPARVTLSESVPCALSDEILPAGRGGVVIRVEPDDSTGGRVLVDFGSCGILRLDPKQTDFLGQYEQHASGQKLKEFPNWTMMLGRAFVRVDKGIINAIKLKELLAYDSMLIVYVEDFEDPDLIELMSVAEQSDFSKTLTVLFPSGGANKDVTKSVVTSAGENALEFYYVYPYLSEAYQRALMHNVTDLPTAVMVDMEGKTLIPPVSVFQMKTRLEASTTTIENP